jgi:hypothetical protein
MNLFGNNTLSISDQTGVSFLIDISLDNINGQCNLGFNENTQSVNFKFINGKIFDPEGNLIYTYNPNENIKLSGNINSNGYDYYINDYYLSNNSSKSYQIFNEFYLNTSSCIADTDIYINGNRPNYKLDFNNLYYVRENITGFISGDNALNFRIYSGDIVYPANSDFLISTLPFFYEEISGSKRTIVITPDFETTQDLYLNKTGEFIFKLYTNFGEITGSYNLTSEYYTSGYINYFDITKISETFFNTVGQYNTDSYLVNIDFASGNETGQYSVPKNLSFKFEYASGYTGNIETNININTGISPNLTGFISGSGYLSGLFSVTGTGVNLLTNSLVTGGITSNVSGFKYLNGFVTNRFNLLGSGGALYSVEVSGSQTGIFLGKSVALNQNGNIGVIGAPGYNSDSGIVYIFSGANNTWNKIAELSGDNNGQDFFGYSVACNDSGNRILVGAFLDDTVGVAGGAAYIYTGSGNNWNYQKLNLGNLDYFGWDVALNKSGNIAVIGGRIDAGFNGAAWIFTGDKLNYVQQQKLTGDGGADQFGYSVAINNSGNIIAIGEPLDNSGIAWIFTGNGTSWNVCKKISGQNGADLFGNSIAINGDGNSIIVGSNHSNNYSGLGFLFTGNGIDWNLARIFSGDAGQDYYGVSVDINDIGNKIIIGAYHDNNNSGKAWVYTGSGSNWVNILQFTGSNTSGKFGTDVSLNGSGNIYLIGEEEASTARFITNDIFYSGITGNISGFAENGILLYEDFVTQTANGITYSGYIDSIIATGITSGNYDFLLTGSTTITYQKTFTGTFNVITGYVYEDASGNLIPTGNINFRSGNYIVDGKYTSGVNLPSQTNQINIYIEKNNLYDNLALSGNLYITGKNINNTLISGIKIPVIYSGINVFYPENIVILGP